MKMNKQIKNIALVFAALILFLSGVSLVLAQSKLQKSPGGYHGELDFPISWKRYYSYAEWTKIMHDIQKKYPQLSDIQSIGKSRMGRDQYPWMGPMVLFQLNLALPNISTDPNDERIAWGLIRRDGSKRPAFTAVQQYAKEWNAANR